jgi:hypothetical protein
LAEDERIIQKDGWAATLLHNLISTVAVAAEDLVNREIEPTPDHLEAVLTIGSRIVKIEASIQDKDSGSWQISLGDLETTTYGATNT